MNVSGALPIFLCASFGGLLTELLKWYQLREADSLPKYARSPRYWVLSLAMILAGGGLALLYGTDQKNAIMVLNIGLSAPLMVKVLAETQLNKVPEAPATPGFRMGNASHGTGDLLRFLSWR